MNYLLTLDTNLVNDMIGVKVNNIRIQQKQKKLFNELQSELNCMYNQFIYMDRGDVPELEDLDAINEYEYSESDQYSYFISNLFYNFGFDY